MDGDDLRPPEGVRWVWTGALVLASVPLALAVFGSDSGNVGALLFTSAALMYGPIAYSRMLGYRLPVWHRHLAIVCAALMALAAALTLRG